MGDDEKGAGLYVRPAHGGTASDRQKHDQDDATAQTGRTGARGGLSEQTRNRLAIQLRAMYDTVTQQPVPDRFAELIAKLDNGSHGS